MWTIDAVGVDFLMEKVFRAGHYYQPNQYANPQFEPLKSFGVVPGSGD
jgi:hypothetical protein